MHRFGIVPLILLAGCGNPPAVVPPVTTTPPAAPVAEAPSPRSPEPAPREAPKEAPKEPAKAAPKEVQAPTPPKVAAAPPVAPKVAAPATPPKASPPKTEPPKAVTLAPAPAPVTAAAPKPPPLDLKSLETRLKNTDAIGVLTKLSLKNQVDDLIGRFKSFHAGHRPPTLADLRPSFDLLLMKVLSLLQDDDKPLANDINASREALWGVLTDRDKLASYT
jgi:hypothetical protein